MAALLGCLCPKTAFRAPIVLRLGGRPKHPSFQPREKNPTSQALHRVSQRGAQPRRGWGPDQNPLLSRFLYMDPALDATEVSRIYDTRNRVAFIYPAFFGQ